ncbi:MAG: trypsin-like peptidase domain-containing protein [Phycisphaerales bacterium]|nr:trypsin-like peptidase domain-containing protein [Phycisphaerales bacterium]
MRRFVAYGPAFVVLLTAASMLIIIPAAVRRITSAHTHARLTLAQQALDQDELLDRLDQAVRNVALAVEPSVVHIEVRDRASRLMTGSTGSGWVFDDAGHVVTNAHVVAGARDIFVQFFDGARVRAELVGADPFADIAVLRVEPGSHLHPMRRATGLRVRQGERVFAFGSPFGFKFSMSEGIVSGLGRNARGPAGFASTTNYIQTDAAINPGNSGGPLVDIRGRLVGMNVAIATSHDTRAADAQSSGISFAIPLTTIETRVPQILAGGFVPGFLGVSFRDSSRFIDDPAFRGTGVTVGSVVPDSPAEKAGLQVGDIIVAIDDEAPGDGAVLRSLISAKAPGEKVMLRVFRRGDQEPAQVLTLEVTLAEAPLSVQAERTAALIYERTGLAINELRRGLFVTGVDPDSPAAGAGFVEGQRIVSAEGSEVATLEAMIQTLTQKGLLRGESVTLGVEDDTGQVKSLTLSVGR